MTTRTNTRANARANMNNVTMRDAREYASHDVMNDDEQRMMNTHNDIMRDIVTRRDDEHDATHDDTTNTTRARIARKLTKRDRAMLRKIARDTNANIAHEHNARWHDVTFDVEVLKKLGIEYKVV